MSAVVKVFYAAKGSRLADEDAQIIGKFIDDEMGGQVTAESFVEEAASRSSPLHPYLEWDDGLAAHEYRLTQARWLIRSICVVDNSAPTDKIRAFHKVTLGDGIVTEAYVSHEIVWQKPELIDQVVAQAYRELRAFTQKYRAYAELQHLVAAVEMVINT